MTHLENDPLKLDTEVDWVVKYHLIEAYRERHDLPLTHPRVALLDLVVPRRHPGAVALLPARAARPGRAHRRPTPTSTRPSTTPPQTTRARLRGAFIKRAKERKRDYTVDWVHLKLNDQAQRTVLCKDPFKARDDRVERLIAPRCSRACRRSAPARSCGCSRSVPGSNGSRSTSADGPERAYVLPQLTGHGRAWATAWS